jgi:hypothetical protein
MPFGLSSDAVSGLGGAIIGGLFTLAGQLVGDRHTRSAASAAAAQMLKATALLMQDDFLHYQATLANAIERRGWWKPEELLIRQTSIDDRKIVWAAISDSTETNTVADAQGWMDVLIASCPSKHAGAPKLTAEQFKRMQSTFVELEHGRKILARISDRPYKSFERSGVLKDFVHCKTIAALKARRLTDAE